MADPLSNSDMVKLEAAVARGASWPEAKALLPDTADERIEAAKAAVYLAVAKAFGKTPPPPEQLFVVEAIGTETIQQLGTLSAGGASWLDACARFPRISRDTLDSHREAAEAWAKDHPEPLMTTPH